MLSPSPRPGVLVLALSPLAALALLGATPPAAAEPAPRGRVVLAYETGPAAILQNDGRYGEDGTAYEAGDVGQTNNLVRVERATLELGLGAGARHRVALLYAPFEVLTRVRLDDALRFRDTSFDAGRVVDHRYLFDGYRATYLYRLVDDATTALDLGVALQVRNADVAFTSVDGERHANESDIGLVFALAARFRHAPADWLWGEVEAVAFSTFGLLSGVAGGIYDVALTLGAPVSDALALTFTTRLLGGGATVEERAIENWGNFFSLTLGVRAALDRLLE